MCVCVCCFVLCVYVLYVFCYECVCVCVCVCNVCVFSPTQEVGLVTEKCSTLQAHSGTVQENLPKDSWQRNKSWHLIFASTTVQV